MDELKISFFPKKGLDRHGFTGLRFHSTAQHSTAQHSTAQRADLAIFAPCYRKALKAAYYIRDG